MKTLSLAEAQYLAEATLNILYKFDLEAHEKFDAYIELFWNDQVSLEEAITDMLEIFA